MPGFLQGTVHKYHHLKNFKCTAEIADIPKKSHKLTVFYADVSDLELIPLQSESFCIYRNFSKK